MQTLYKIDRNSSCAVIGYGSWATALVHALQANNREVYWHVTNPEVAESLANDSRNVKYLNDVEFDMNHIHLSTDINEVISSSDTVLIAVPSAFLKNTLSKLTVSLDGKFIISAIKGIVPEDYKTVIEFIHDNFNVPFSRTGLISGPTHAEEVSRDKLSYLTVVCSDERNATVIQDMFGSDKIRTKWSKDIYGIEYAAILKNIYAIAAGLATGLGYGDNFLAVLVSASACELSRFLNETWPFERNTMDSAYLGDLLVTSYSTFSRNKRLGTLIGRGCTVKSALNEMTMVAEGYYASEGIRHLNLRHKVDMPIADMVWQVLHNGANPRKKMLELSSLL
ncbi:MAG: NAD(P)H-dependent glycerol-3-phosphate dehydrogenase [Candidatus Cryptobacteroides sp.]